MIVRVCLWGVPAGKGRPRFSRKNGVAFTPAKTRAFENHLGAEAAKAMNGTAPLEGPLAVFVLAVFPIPQSWSMKKKAAALIGQIRPTTKPDWENVAKTLDAFNQIVWRDDSQVVDGRVKKIYGDRPRLVVTVAAIGEEKNARPADGSQLPLPDAPWRTADA